METSFYIMAWFSLTFMTVCVMGLMIEAGNLIAYGLIKVFKHMQKQPKQSYYTLSSIQSNYKVDKVKIAA